MERHGRLAVVVNALGNGEQVVLVDRDDPVEAKPGPVGPFQRDRFAGREAWAIGGPRRLAVGHRHFLVARNRPAEIGEEPVRRGRRRHQRDLRAVGIVDWPLCSNFVFLLAVLVKLTMFRSDIY